MGINIVNPGPFGEFKGDLAEYDKALNAFRLVQTRAIPDLADLTIIEVPESLQRLPELPPGIGA